MNFFGVGPAEAGVIFVIALIVIGPQRFPEIMRQAGRWYRVARAYSNEVMKDVRAAVDEIEQEVRADTEDLRSVRELTDIKADLKEARESAEDIRRDTQAAASEDKPATTEATKPASQAASSASKSSTGTGTNTGTSVTRPSTLKAAREQASSKPADPPASHYEGRDPSTYDPFKAKEARERERAAARDDAEASNGTP